MEVRPLVDDDREWVAELVAQRWGAPIVVSRRRTHRPSDLDGFVALDEGRPPRAALLPARGFVLAALHRDALAEARRHVIPLRDELELERLL